MKEENLIAACKEGNRKAQYDLYQKYYSTLMAICRRYHNNDSDAALVLNAAFLKIFKNIYYFKNNSKGSFIAWAKRITVNTLIDDYRSKRKDKEIFEYKSNDDLPEYNFQRNYLNHHLELTEEMLLNMIQRLPEGHQVVFNLFAMEGYSHKEISELCDFSEGTSKWHLSAARKKLSSMINEVRTSKMSKI